MTRRPLAVAIAVLPVLALTLGACGKKDTNDALPPPTPVTVTQTVTETPSVLPTTAPPTTPTEAPPTTPVAPPTTPVEPTKAPPVDLSQPPGTFDAAMAHIASAAGTVSTRRFYTPSGNIYCLMKSPFFDAACELGSGAIEDTSYCGNGPASTSIGRIEMEKGTATPVCNSDTIKTPGGGSLDYGTIDQYAGSSVECLSEVIGVTCVDTSSQSGFFLAKGKYLIFSHGG